MLNPSFVRACHSGTVGLLAALMTFSTTATAGAQAASPFTLSEIEVPVGPGAQTPSLFLTQDGGLLMSWTEPDGSGFSVRTAVRDSKEWSTPQTVVQADDLFINWADFPSVTEFDDGTLAVHWLAENGPTSYDYDVNIALSSDGGETWGDVIVPHRDGARRQHGFVTLLPLAQNRLAAIWLDGRAYDDTATGPEAEAFINAMQLRATTIGSDGNLSEDALLDVRTCTCCQTSATVTGDGTVLVAYRDRTEAEIRDISLVRLKDGLWSDPETVHPDGWEISGCPVNGPSIHANEDKVAVAWFTEANETPAVNVAFSNDAGENFGGAIRVDSGDPAGRVQVIHLDDGTALVSWVQWSSLGEAIILCRVSPEKGCEKPQPITLNRVPGSINFPRMIGNLEGAYIAWTQPLSGTVDPDRATTVRMVKVEF